MLTLRANDRFENTVLYQCSSSPPQAGGFEPNGGCSTQPVDVKVGQILPFTFQDPNQFRPDGPDPLTTHEYGLDCTGGIRCDTAIKSVARLRRMWSGASSDRFRDRRGSLIAAPSNLAF